jgi:superfamily II DNA or RNA helicase
VSEKFAAGVQVMLRSDPGRKGMLTGKSRPQGDVIKYQVQFPDGPPSFHPEYELEVVDTITDDPFEALKKGSFGRPIELRRNLTFVQLSGKLANLVYSMETTNTVFYAYQFKPVLSFLESPSNGLLIADEVGLGKTIEAGLIWTELRARYDARRLLVVCPAMLQPKWQHELRERFSIDAQIMSAGEVLTELERDKANVFDGKGMVCSVQGLRPPRGWRDPEKSKSTSAKLAQLLERSAETEPLFDLVIIDEAHYMRNPESQTSALGRLLRDVAEHVVLLSATPVNLRDDDLYYLLNLVDPENFYSKAIFPQVIEANEPLHNARRLALDKRATSAQIWSELGKARSHHLLRNSNQLRDLIARPMSDEELERESERISLANRIERVNLLQHAISRTRKVDVTEWRVVRQPKSYFVSLHEDGPEWAFYTSVTNAIRRYAVERDVSEGFLLASPQRQVSSCMYAAAKSWRDRADALDEQMYEDFGAEDVETVDVSPLISYIRQHVLPYIDLQVLREHDSKFNDFRRVLLAYLQSNPTEKVVVFSYFRGTIAYLAERLAEEGVVSQVLVGGMAESKQSIIDQFRENVGLRVLLSTEVASEGVDLQFCRVLINYDLPWNPMKVEQRIGRIDRLGQMSETVSILSLCYANTIDQRIHDRLYKRLKIFERALGGLEAILGEQISDLTGDLLRQNLTPEQEAQRIEKTALAVEQIRQQKEELEGQASSLIAHGGYILSQVEAAHQFKRRITNADLRVYVEDYLNRYCTGFVFRQLDADGQLFELQLSPQSAAKLDAFMRQEKLNVRTALAAGDRVKCRFVNRVQNLSRAEEFIGQFHPLVRFISQDLRGRQESFYPLVAMILPEGHADGIPAGRYGFCVRRWTFKGLKVNEEIRARAVELGGRSPLLEPDQSFELVNAARVSARDWLSAENDVDRDLLAAALDSCEIGLQADYEAEAARREVENLDRIAFQIQSAERHRDRLLGSREQALIRLRERGRTKMIPAAEGRIHAVKKKFEAQVARLQSQQKLRHSQSDVCVGIINVSG